MNIDNINIDAILDEAGDDIVRLYDLLIEVVQANGGTEEDVVLLLDAISVKLAADARAAEQTIENGTFMLKASRDLKATRLQRMNETKALYARETAVLEA